MISLKRILAFALALLLVGHVPLGAQDDEEVPLQDQYLTIYMLIRNTQELEESGNKATARKHYETALKQLVKIQKQNPGWQTAIIAYRIKNCKEKLKELEGATDANPSEIPAHMQDTGADESTQPDDGLPTKSDPEPEVAAVTPQFDPAEIEQLKAEVERLKSELENERIKIETLENERNSLRLAVARANSDLAKVKQDDNNEKVADLLKENEQLKNQLNAAETQIASLSNDADSESNITMLTAQLEKVRTQLAAQTELNRQFEKATADLKAKLGETERELMLARQAPPEAGESNEQMTKENEMLRDIIRRQLQEQARRNVAKKLIQEELMDLKVQSATLDQQIDVITSPLVPLSEQEMAMLKMSAPDVLAATSAGGEPTLTAPAETLVAQADAAAGDDLPEIDMGGDDNSANGSSAEPAPGETVEVVETTETVEVADNTPPDSGVPADEDNTLPMPDDSGTPATASAAPAAEPAQGSDVASKPRVPEDVRDLAQQASEFYANGRFDDAADRYEQMIERYPESLYAWSNLGVVRYQQKRYEDSSTALQQAVKLSPSDGFSYSILGIVYYQTGNLEEAIQALTRAKALDPNNAKTRNYLGIAAAQKGWQESAEKELRKAVEIAPEYGDAHFNLAVIYATQKPPSKELARKHYAKAKTLGVPKDKQLERLLN